MDHILTSISWNESNWAEPAAEVTKFGYPRESGTEGAEGRNFDPKAKVSGGYKRAYFPQNRFASLIKNPCNGSWCVVFTSRRPGRLGGGRFIVGVYLNAEVGEFDGLNLRVRPEDIIVLKPRGHVRFDNDRHCRNKKAVRTLVYIDDIDLQEIFKDILRSYSRTLDLE